MEMPLKIFIIIPIIPIIKRTRVYNKIPPYCRPTIEKSAEQKSIKMPSKKHKITRTSFKKVKIRLYLLFLQTVLVTAGGASQYRMKGSYTLTVNVIFRPSKANTLRLKNTSCSRNEPKQCTTSTWQRSGS